MSEIDRDHRLDAAWRAASRDEPPPALDAAIRAAARRAVDAAPRRKRNKHWWYPLASAAMVAVLAVAIVQLTPPERVAPTIVADVTVAPRAAQKEAAPALASDEKKLADPLAAEDATTPAAKPQAPARRNQGAAEGSLARERAGTPGAERDAKKPPYAAKRELAMQDQLASAKSDAGAADAAPATVPAPVTPPRSEPFPAAAPTPRHDAPAEQRPSAASASAGTVAPQVARSAAAPRSEEEQAGNRVAMAKIKSADDAKAKDASARSVEEWIKRIRELRNEGRIDDAAKELAAFRAAYRERADALLPADLRAFKAQPAAK